jgi:hypothetical protein
MRDILEVGVMSLTASAKIRILMTRFTMRTAKKAIFKYDVVPAERVCVFVCVCVCACVCVCVCVYVCVCVCVCV